MSHLANLLVVVAIFICRDSRWTAADDAARLLLLSFRFLLDVDLLLSHLIEDLLRRDIGLLSHPGVANDVCDLWAIAWIIL